MKPFTLDVTAQLITYGVEYYLQNHPTQPDNFNAALQAVVSALNALDVAESGGVQVLSVNTENFQHQGAGVFEIQVDSLQSQVSMGSLLLRDNAGAFEFSDDAGATWSAVGSGGGGVSDHTLLTNIGTNTHAQVDTHLADSGLHTDTTDHTALSNVGSNTHAQLDTHLADNGQHSDTTDHTALSNVGSNTHVQLDAHLADSGLHGATSAEYVLRGDGLSNLATGDHWALDLNSKLNQSELTLIGQFTPHLFNSASSFFKYVNLSYGYTVLNFGLTSLNKLFITQGDANTGAQETIESLSFLNSAYDLHMPQVFGVLISRLTDQVAFIIGGKVEAAQSFTQPHTHVGVNLLHSLTLGEAFNGDCSYFGVGTETLWYHYGTQNTPYPGGLAAGKNLTLYYDMTQDSGLALEEITSVQRSTVAIDLTVNGTWTAP